MILYYFIDRIMAEVSSKPQKFHYKVLDINLNHVEKFPKTDEVEWGCSHLELIWLTLTSMYFINVNVIYNVF